MHPTCLCTVFTRVVLNMLDQTVELWIWSVPPQMSSMTVDLSTCTRPNEEGARAFTCADSQSLCQVCMAMHGD